MRSEGKCSSLTNPWPARDMAGHRCVEEETYIQEARPRNRWHQYGESSSAASSEAHIASEQVRVESNGHQMSQAAEMRGQLNHIDFIRLTK